MTLKMEAIAIVLLKPYSEEGGEGWKTSGANGSRTEQLSTAGCVIASSNRSVECRL